MLIPAPDLKGTHMSMQSPQKRRIEGIIADYILAHTAHRLFFYILAADNIVLSSSRWDGEFEAEKVVFMPCQARRAEKRD